MGLRVWMYLSRDWCWRTIRGPRLSLCAIQRSLRWTMTREPVDHLIPRSSPFGFNSGPGESARRKKDCDVTLARLLFITRQKAGGISARLAGCRTIHLSTRHPNPKSPSTQPGPRIRQGAEGAAQVELGRIQ